MASGKAVHVPYKGDTPAMTAVMAGHVSMMFTTAVAAMPHIKSGKLRVGAVHEQLQSLLAALRAG